MTIPKKLAIYNTLKDREMIYTPQLFTKKVSPTTGLKDELLIEISFLKMQFIKPDTFEDGITGGRTVGLHIPLTVKLAV